MARRLEKCIDFSSNDYLSLSNAKQARETVAKKLLQGLALGSTGSRLLDGDSDAHTALEERLAREFHAEASLLFNSGFDANVSLLTTLPQSGDAIIYDELVHASMHDGMRSSRAKFRHAFKHNDPDSLSVILTEVVPKSQNLFLALESVYSMDGTVCCLNELLDVFFRHVPDPERRCILVDEAHGIGVYGEKGTGLVSALNACDTVDIRLLTFGKALGSSGAAVLCSQLQREYLLNYARPLIYSTALSPVVVASIDAMLDVLQEDVQRQAMLHARTRYMYDALNRSIMPSLVPPSPILPVRSQQAKALAAHLQNQGFLVRGVTYPTVPIGEDRIRICIHANNTEAQISALAAEILRWESGKASL
ncbi:8-amino-7-oxononanoate synthase [Malassezia psittaci]|uniref:8-amino-7-oxononanoate synthase n=1 Tax=Malassezia psittaci TaxID=1821823 RepID=A0AAF0FA42_9BASI|nr:8-amino-7-oxononanoate synthase [Malassezia psittaci]